jgi:hypothetical protein
MQEHRHRIDRDLRRRVLEHVRQQAEKLLTIRWTRVMARVSTAYDEPRFMGPNSIVKYRYSFQGVFEHSRRRERLSFDFEFEPRPAGFELAWSDPRAFTHADELRRRALQRNRERVDRRQQKRARAFLKGTFDECWKRCVSRWKRARVVMGPHVGFPGETPFEFRICVELARRHAGLLRDKLSDPDPLPAAYAFLGLLHKKLLPRSLPDRSETIAWRSGCFGGTAPLGDFMRNERAEAKARPRDPVKLDPWSPRLRWHL